MSEPTLPLSTVLNGATLIGYNKDVHGDQMVVWNGSCTFNVYMVNFITEEFEEVDMFTAGFESGLSKEEAAEHMRDRGFESVI